MSQPPPPPSGPPPSRPNPPSRPPPPRSQPPPPRSSRPPPPNAAPPPPKPSSQPPPPPGPPRRVPHAFDESQLPSLRHGLTTAQERDKRRRTCRFIEEAGRVLKLPRVAVATAMVLFHRFYAKHSFTEHDRFEAAAAALLLAAKTEESPKKLTHVIQECHRLKNRGLQKQKEVMAGAAATAAAAAGRNSPVPIGYLDTKGKEFAKLKDRILLLERVILHTIGFELSIDHPYKFLVEQVKKMLVARQVEYITPPPPPSSSTSTAAGPSSSPPSNMAKMTNELVQYAMNFANDSMHTSLCLQFNAKTIALACVYMSVKFTKVRPTEGKMWSDILGIEMEALASISMQIMELIADKKGCELPIFETIRCDLAKMRERKAMQTQRSSGGGTSVKHESSSAVPSRDPKRPRTS